MHNPVRGLRVLSLDGGGCKGIIPLKFLQVLEDWISLPFPVQENFDLFLGPSSGKLMAYLLISLADCEAKELSLS
jgi:patatin-like phospholipase/acyl hydrolase